VIPFLPHQIEGATFLSARERAGLFDEMGTGKTATTIAALDALGAEKIMIVCPAAVKQVWIGELRKFSTRELRVLNDKDVYNLKQWSRNGAAQVYVTSYEKAAKWGSFVDDVFDVLVLDEAHYLKSPSAQRTKKILGNDCDGRRGLAAKAAQTWFLTGTPIPNDPTDVWSFMRFTGATTLTYAKFTSRYFTSRLGTFSSRQEVKKELVPELRALIESVSMRRTKNDIGLKLPPVWLTTTTVDGDAAEIVAMMREWPGLEDAIVQAIEQGGLSFLDAQHVATLRRLVGEAKAPAYIELVAEELESGLDKLVVMGAHKQALRMVRIGLEARGYKVVMIDGSTSETARKEAVESFQNDPDVRVFVGNIRAAGTGLTLTAAAHMAHGEAAALLEPSQTLGREARLLGDAVGAVAIQDGGPREVRASAIAGAADHRQRHLRAIGAGGHQALGHQAAGVQRAGGLQGHRARRSAGLKPAPR
jgi:SWI/SNF-related matrix-associated actin-dependent regulator 1 of chromatin subfamily A